MDAKSGELVERDVDLDVGTIGAIVGAEVDKQIATARRFPRSITKVRDEAISLASMNEDVAAECFYSLERAGDGGVKKTITGPSARLAEIVAYSWGNLRAGARVVAEDEDFVTAQGFAWDLEKNVALGYEVKRRIRTSSGKRYSLDMIGMTANAACSIALRNAIFKVIPKALWGEAFEKALATVRGDFSTFEARRTKAIDALKAAGIVEASIYAKLGIGGFDDVTIDHIVELRGFLTAIKDGDSTPEELFPRPAKPGERSASAGLKAAMAGPDEAKPPVVEKQIATGPKEIADAVAKVADFKDLETLALWADTLPGEVKTANDFLLAYRDRVKALSGGIGPGTPKLRKQYLAKIENADHPKTLEIVWEETKGFAWTGEDYAAILAAYNARKIKLAEPQA